MAKQSKKLQNENSKIGEEGFWESWISKFLFTLISVKVWGLAVSIIVSTVLLSGKYINGAQWLTFNTTIWALIFGMKEVFRIAEGRDKADSVILNQKAEQSVNLAKLNQQLANSNNPQVNPGGTEVVGEEPDEF